MTNGRDGEPVESARRGRSEAERRARRDAFIVVALFGAALLINGLLAVAVIAILQALGLWDPTTVVEWIEGSARWGRWRVSDG